MIPSFHEGLIFSEGKVVAFCSCTNKVLNEELVSCCTGLKRRVFLCTTRGKDPLVNGENVQRMPPIIPANE